MASSLSFRFIKTILKINRFALGTAPRSCVEAGTYRGDSTMELVKCFDKVHSIELSEKWFQYSKERLKGHPNATFYLGDSASVMQQLLLKIDGSIFFFLDAHFAGGDTAMGEDEVPLLRELKILKERKEKDLIVIDDIRLMGKSGKCGIEGDSVYPRMNFDWLNVTVASIEKLIGKGIRNPWMERGDKFIIFRNQSIVSGLVLISIINLIKIIEMFVKFNNSNGGAK